MHLLLIARIANGAVPILSIPIFLHFLGPESIGSIQIIAVITALLVVADLGLSPTIARIAGRFHSSSPSHWYRCLKVAEGGIALVALIIFTLIATLSSPSMLPSTFKMEHANALFVLMAFSVCLRLPISLYVSALAGAQSNKTLIHYYIFSGSARLVLVSAVLSVVPNLFAFFIAQIAISCISLIFLRSSIMCQLKNEIHVPGGSDTRDILKSEWQFGASMTGIAAFGAIYTYADRIVLSQQLSLSQFTSYSLAGSLAGGLMLVATSFFSVYYPKFCASYTPQGFSNSAKDIAFQAGFKISICLLLPASFIVAFPREILSAWLGDDQIAAEAFVALTFIAIGNTFNGLASIPYAIQLAAGRATQALTINVILLSVALPGMWIASSVGGLNAAAMLWAVLNIIIAIIWVCVVVPSDLGVSPYVWWNRTLREPVFAAFAPFVFSLVTSSFFPTVKPNLVSLLILLSVHIALFALALRVVRSFLLSKLSTLNRK